MLISDGGTDTCGGDLCSAAAALHTQHPELVLHTVGFGITDAERSRALECSAQAGGGVFVDADHEEDLRTTLKKITTIGTDVPTGGVHVTAVADGAPVAAEIRILRANQEEVAHGRLFDTGSLRERRLPLPDGNYSLMVVATKLRGAPMHRQAFSVQNGETTPLAFDFSRGQLAVSVTLNGRWSEATVDAERATSTRKVRSGQTFREERATSTRKVRSGQTFRDDRSQPLVLELHAGLYDLAITNRELSNEEQIQVRGIEVRPLERTTYVQDFAAGTIRIGARRGETLIDALIRVLDSTGDEVNRGRTHDQAATNPQGFVLAPGRYRVQLVLQSAKSPGKHSFEVDLTAGAEVEEMVAFD